MMNITFMEWLILGLASFRLVRLVLYDTIAEPFRRLFTMDNQNEQQTVSLWTGVRYLIAYLLTCPWCAGMWIVAFLFAIHIWVPIADPLIVVLSIAGFVALLHEYLE